MILNKSEMQMARELARELTGINEMEDEQVIETLRDFVSELKRILTDAWNHIKEIVNDVVHLIYDRETEKKHAYGWIVPLNTTRPSQIKVPNVRIPSIRSQL